MCSFLERVVLSLVYLDEIHSCILFLTSWNRSALDQRFLTRWMEEVGWMKSVLFVSSSNLHVFTQNISAIMNKTTNFQVF